MIQTIASTSPRIIEILKVTKSLFDRILPIDVLRNSVKISPLIVHRMRYNKNIKTKGKDKIGDEAHDLKMLIQQEF